MTTSRNTDSKDSLVERSLQLIFLPPRRQFSSATQLPSAIAESVFRQESTAQSIQKFKPQPYGQSTVDYDESSEATAAKTYFEQEAPNLNQLLLQDIKTLTPAQQRKIFVDILYRESKPTIDTMLKAVFGFTIRGRDNLVYRQKIEKLFLSYNKESQEKIIQQLLTRYLLPDQTENNKRNVPVLHSIFRHYIYYALENLHRQQLLQTHVRKQLEQLNNKGISLAEILQSEVLSATDKLLLNSKIASGEIDLDYVVNIGPLEAVRRLKKQAKWYELAWQYFITIFFGGGRTLATIGLSFLFFFTFVALFGLTWPGWLLIALGSAAALATAVAFLLSRVMAIYTSFAPCAVEKPKLKAEDNIKNVDWPIIVLLALLGMVATTYVAITAGFGILIAIAIAAACAAIYALCLSNRRGWKVASIISALGTATAAYVGIAVGVTKFLAQLSVTVSPTSVIIIPMAIVFALSTGLSHSCFLAKDLDIKWNQFKNFFQGSNCNKVCAIIAAIVLGLASGLVLIFTTMSGIKKLLDLGNNGSNAEKTSLAGDIIGIWLTLATLLTNTLSQVAKCVSFISGTATNSTSANSTTNADAVIAPEDFNVDYLQQSGAQRRHQIWVRVTNWLKTMSWWQITGIVCLMVFDVGVYGGIGTVISSCAMFALFGLAATNPITIGCSAFFAIIGMLTYFCYTYNAVVEKFGKLKNYAPSTTTATSEVKSESSPTPTTQLQPQQQEQTTPAKAISKIGINAEASTASASEQQHAASQCCGGQGCQYHRLS